MFPTLSASPCVHSLPLRVRYLPLTVRLRSLVAQARSSEANLIPLIMSWRMLSRRFSPVAARAAGSSRMDTIFFVMLLGGCCGAPIRSSGSVCTKVCRGFLTTSKRGTRAALPSPHSHLLTPLSFSFSRQQKKKHKTKKNGGSSDGTFAPPPPTKT